MASGPPVGGDNGAKEKPRYAENKVYIRKVFKGSRKDPLKTVAAAKPPATVVTAAPEPSSAPPSVSFPNSELSPARVATPPVTSPAATSPTATATLDAPDPTLVVTTEPTLAVSPESTPAAAPEPTVSEPASAVEPDSAPSSTPTVVPEPTSEPIPPITTEATLAVVLEGPSDSAPDAVAPAPDVEITGTNENNVENHSIQEQAAPETILLSEDGDSLQQQPETSHPDAARDDCSLNQQESAVPSATVLPQGNNAVEQDGPSNKVKINLASRSRQEVRELRRRLQGELDVVRNWVKRIEEKEGMVSGFSQPPVLENVAVDNGVQRFQPEVVPMSIPPRENRPLNLLTRPLNQLSISVLENSIGVTEGLEKEKRTPKANPFYRNSEFLLAKDKFPPAESNRKSKVNGKKKGSDVRSGHGVTSRFFKNCGSLLDRLMKHTYGWVFNNPVDVKGLGLHDYYTIIKHPMDLGTVKARLTSNSYRIPKEFADDVRLTFHNAMTYNPKGQDVHYMAATLLKIFEEKWATIESDYNRELRFAMDYEMSVPTPTSRKAPAPFLPPSLDMRRVLDRSDSITHSIDYRPKPVSITPTGRTPAPKKPKAKDLNKRDMTFDEKQKLSTNLQNLPSDKLDNIVQIIKKRNSALRQHDDEIEVDIDSVDTETLWELDRFVTNYKKSLSKHKRKAELALQRAQAPQAPADKDTRSAVVEVPQETHTAQNVVSSSPVQDENHGVNSSRSSSSSSSSSDSGSSSSDSDSDSSSSSDTDAGHSPRT